VRAFITSIDRIEHAGQTRATREGSRIIQTLTYEGVKSIPDITGNHHKYRDRYDDEILGKIVNASQMVVCVAQRVGRGGYGPGRVISPAAIKSCEIEQRQGDLYRRNTAKPMLDESFHRYQMMVNAICLESIYMLYLPGRGLKPTKERTLRGKTVYSQWMMEIIR